MTSQLTNYSLGLMTLVVALVLMMMSASPAHAQSEVTGTITSGTAATGSTATGTINGGGGNTLTGTVVEEDSGGGGGGGGGGSSRRNSNNNDDGDVLGTSTDIPSGVGGGGDFPGVPNTGVGGGAPLTWGILLGSLLLMIGGGVALARNRFS